MKKTAAIFSLLLTYGCVATNLDFEPKLNTALSGVSVQLALDRAERAEASVKGIKGEEAYQELQSIKRSKWKEFREKGADPDNYLR